MCNRQYRVTRVSDQSNVQEWTALVGEVQDGVFHSQARIPAGGWYRLDIRAIVLDVVIGKDSVEPFGVGEVFLIAGQSYADGCNKVLLSVRDNEKRVASFDCASQNWRVGNDPQPNSCPGGTIERPLKDLSPDLSA